MTKSISPALPLTEAARAFIDGILSLQPKVAIFDCDGTLWDLDAGAGFFYWEIEQGLIPGKTASAATVRYDEYKNGRVDELTMCGEMVQIHRDIPTERIEAAAEHFCRTFVDPVIFPEMLELTKALQQQGCELWAVSSSNEWVIRAGVRQFGIAPDHVLAASVAVENGLATDRLIRVPTDEWKAVVVREIVGETPEVVFGNSMHDAAMLAIARRAFAINPNPDLDALAATKGWTRYYPVESRGRR